MPKEQNNKPISSITILGLGLSLAVPAIYVLWINPIFIKPNIDEPMLTLMNLGIFWIFALVMLLFTIKVEKSSLATIGWRPLSWKWILAAIGIGILLSLLVPVLTYLASKVIPSTDAGTISNVTSNFPWWVLLLSVITAGITEEILFRGYPLERLLNSTNNKWISAGVSLIFFVAIHAMGWNFAHIVGVVVPLGIALTALYLWRRNLLFVMIVHIVIDLPLVFMALFS